MELPAVGVSRHLRRPSSPESKMPKPVAFITGASTGIGFETAKQLRSNGFQVYAGARRVDRMQPLAALGVQAWHST